MAVFSRAPGNDLPVVARGTGALLFDTDGRRYLDGSGGAIVVGIGHGVEEVGDAIAKQSKLVAYAHGTAFTSSALEDYIAELSPLLPMDDPFVYPVSGGSEAVETALKMARAYHLARGEDRSVVIGREGAYHGNTRGALDVSGRVGLRAPYLPWLGSAAHTTTPYEYRYPLSGQQHADHLERLIVAQGPGNVAAFIAEPISGAALGACVPPDDYWPAITAICRKYGVLVIADEVMTGFGRTGKWFACEHWDVRPDILVAAKGAASGYWPLGFAACSGEVHEKIAGFTHGFTYSHHVVGAAAGHAVLKVLKDRDLIAASERKGALLKSALEDALGDHPAVGDIRGLGLLCAVEFVADRSTRTPYPRADRIAERIVAAGKEDGVLLYHSTGCADGVNGDLILFGPPLVITDAQIAELAERAANAASRVIGAVGSSCPPGRTS